MFYKLLAIQRFFEQLYQTLISALRIFLRFRFKDNLKDHRIKGGELTILGNGPSLANTLNNPPSFMADSDLMALNQFALSDAFVRLKPKYYVLLDIGYFKENTLPRVQAITYKLIEAFSEKTNWNMKLLIPAEGKGSKLHQEIKTHNSHIEFVFFNRTNVEGITFFRHFAYKRNWGMPKPQNVLVGCLILALCMSYKRVYLLGADHSWLENIRISNDNSLVSIEKHFYDHDKKGIPTKLEHPETQKARFLHDYLQNLAHTFSSYHVISRWATQLDARIINATSGSYIDAFERLK